jgi:1,4-dihydroxy-2-naphthoate polyprenyltransferase
MSDTPKNKSRSVQSQPENQRIGQIVAMFRLARPVILQGGVLAYGLGVAMGYAQQGSVDWKKAVIGLAITELANLVAHYADEYADVDTDSLTRRTHFSGGSGVLPSGTIPAVWALYAAWLLTITTIGLTVWFILSGVLSWHIAWIVGVGLFGGWFYSMPPVAFERRGLGEIDNAMLGAFIMPLMGFTVQTGEPTLDAFVNLTPIFSIVMVGLIGVHWADRLADAAVGKRSLVVIVGERIRFAHYGFAALAYVLALVLAEYTMPLQVSLAILATFPVGMWAVATFGKDSSPTPSVFAMMGTIAAASIGWVFVGI